MQVFSDRHFETLADQSYANACACHGDLGLDAEAFSNHLCSIILKRMGADSIPSAIFEFVRSLHLNDLYLTLACALGSEAAWHRFALSYGPYIRRVSECVCSSRDVARDIADSVLGHMFLPDSTGRSRMASYEGFTPLTTWLTAIIKHSAVNERRLKFNNLENLDLASTESDDSSIYKTEAAIRADKYEQLIRDSLQGAIRLLTDRERFILRLRYEQELQLNQVARLLDVKPPAVSRRLDRIREKLREQVILNLSIKHRLGPAVIQECLTDIVENPEHCILALS